VTMYQIRHDLLFRNGRRVSYKLSPNHGGMISPRLIVVHYTGTESLQSVLRWLCTPAAQASAHVVIAKTGLIWQLVPFNLRAWHAGKSEYDGRPEVNDFSIGIENLGLGDDWPEAQIKANIEVIKALCKAYPIYALAGHDEVAIPPGRKPDPGPKYPWEMILRECGFEEE